MALPPVKFWAKNVLPNMINGKDCVLAELREERAEGEHAVNNKAL